MGFTFHTWCAVQSAIAGLVVLVIDKYRNTSNHLAVIAELLFNSRVIQDAVDGQRYIYVGGLW